jgi:hypothetical protein
MNRVIPEDYSGDLRTILAKERTILSHQAVQLTKIGLSMGVFGSGLAIVRFITTDEHAGWIIAAGLMIISVIVGIRAYIKYWNLAADLNKVTEVEEKMARGYRKNMIREHSVKQKKLSEE